MIVKTYKPLSASNFVSFFFVTICTTNTHISMMKSELEISMERFVLIFRLFLFFVDIQLHDFLAMKKRVLYFMYLILYSKAMIYSNCWFSVHFNILLPVWLNIPNHNWLLIQGFLWPQSFSVDEGNPIGFCVVWFSWRSTEWSVEMTG